MYQTDFYLTEGLTYVALQLSEAAAVVMPADPTNEALSIFQFLDSTKINNYP